LDIRQTASVPSRRWQPQASCRMVAAETHAWRSCVAYACRQRAPRPRNGQYNDGSLRARHAGHAASRSAHARHDSPRGSLVSLTSALAVWAFSEKFLTNCVMVRKRGFEPPRYCYRQPVGLEFLVSPRLATGRGLDSKTPSAPDSDRPLPTRVRQRRSTASVRPMTHGSGPCCSGPGTRQASVPDHEYSRTALGRGTPVASSRSSARPYGWDSGTCGTVLISSISRIRRFATQWCASSTGS
jgi:hypothetical protein